MTGIPLNFIATNVMSNNEKPPSRFAENDIEIPAYEATVITASQTITMQSEAINVL